MATDYTYLYEEYPDVISADQLCRICHISKRKRLNPVAQICQKEFQRFLYNIWTDEADILRISDVQVLPGYSVGTIRQWILRKELRKGARDRVSAKVWSLNIFGGLGTVISTVCTCFFGRRPWSWIRFLWKYLVR